MIKAVIFDCFGVLTTDGWLAFRDKYFPENDERRAEATELNRQADAGLITNEAFEESLARIAGVSMKDVWAIVDSHVCNGPLFDYIKEELKPHYKIGLLSNAAADHTHELFTPEQQALLDEKTFSFEIGVVKPHPAMYETIATKLSVLPEECVFIDDREPFAAGAREVGMKALVYRNVLQVRKELPALLEETV